MTKNPKTPKALDAIADTFDELREHPRACPCGRLLVTGARHPLLACPHPARCLVRLVPSEARGGARMAQPDSGDCE